MSNTTDDSTLDGLLDIALDVSKRRVEIFNRLREALLRCDDVKALELAREYCGVEQPKQTTKKKGSK